MDSTEIIEKIRAEIKIRLSANGAFDEEGDSAWHYDQGLNDAYNYILFVLSDLEKAEKPSEGLEEEIDKFLNETGAPYCWCNDDEQKDWCTIIARHFYELGRQSKPVLSDDLEKAAREYAMDDFYNGYSSGSIIEDTMKNFKAGAEWGRRNLLQEIADGKTHPVDGITAAWLDNTED